MSQEQKKPTTGSSEEVEEVEIKNVKNEELDAAVDDILDEIDDVLEENAEEFVAQYRQKGGQ